MGAETHRVLRSGLSPPSRVVALIAMLLAASAAAEERNFDLADFAGTWSRTGIERDDEVREAAILSVTAPMTFLLRGFARSVMRSRLRPADQLIARLDGRALHWRAGEEIFAPLLPDGSTREAPLGEVRDVWLADGRLERKWNRGADEGHGRVVWVLSEDGTRLRHDATAWNANFEGAMQFSTRYVRVIDGD